MSSEDRRLVLILVDGLGFADIEDGRAPFLNSELKNGTVSPLRPALGYSDVQRAVLLTGKSPDQIGYWMLYRFAMSGGSPWRWLSPMKPLDRWGDRFPVRVMKLGLSQSFLKGLAKLQGGDLAIHNMPFRGLRWLRPANEPSAYAGLPIAGTETLLSTANQAEIPWAVIRSDSFSALLRKRSVDDWMPKARAQIRNLDDDTRIVFTYMHFPDFFAHRYGRSHVHSTQEIERVDRALSMLINEYKSKLGDNTEFVVVSDHGMSDTHTFVDYSHLVSHREFGKAFVLALDSTMVRAVYLNDRGRNIVRNALSDAPARLLSSQERQDFRIDFAPEIYGEDIFLFDDGVSIYPNYHSLMRPLSMHAYDPNLDSQTAFIYTNGTGTERAVNDLANERHIDMTDVRSIMAAVIGGPLKIRE